MDMNWVRVVVGLLAMAAMPLAFWFQNRQFERQQRPSE